MKTPLCPAIVLLLITLFCCQRSSAEDWYRWRGPSLNGISSESDWRSDWPDGKANVAWRTSVGIGFSSVVVSNHLAVTIGHVDGHDLVQAIDIADGSTTWRFSYPAALGDRDFEGGPTSTPTIDGERVYVLSRAGELYCFNLQNGDLIWNTSVAIVADVRLPGWGCSSAPLVVGDRLLLNLGEAGAAVNKQTGELLWKSGDREAGYSTAVPLPKADPPAVVIGSGKAYIAVDVETGKELWSERWLTSFNCNAADPIFAGEKMFLSSGYSRGAALFDLRDKGSPQLIWKSKEMKNQIHSSILYQGDLYGIDGDMETGARLRCMDFESGEVRWSEDELRPGGLALAGGRLLLLTELGELIVAPADPEGWKPTARAKVLAGKCWTAPVLSGGRIFCRTIQGELVCIDCRD
jgi:outer membrane protein assembly factor BamB